MRETHSFIPDSINMLHCSYSMELTELKLCPASKGTAFMRSPRWKWMFSGHSFPLRSLQDERQRSKFNTARLWWSARSSTLSTFPLEPTEEGKKHTQSSQLAESFQKVPNVSRTASQNTWTNSWNIFEDSQDPVGYTRGNKLQALVASDQYVTNFW